MKFDKKSEILITCPKEIPQYLEQELKNLGFPILYTRKAAVATEGTLKDCMFLNMHIRTGHRVLWCLDKYRIQNPDVLYKNGRKLPWEDIIPQKGYFSVSASVLNDTIKDTRFASYKLKDAIVDRMREQTNSRPDSGPLETKTVIFLYWKENDCAIYLDTSGEPLSKRGYRINPNKAPMQETLAAAVIMASGYDGSTGFVNPMCGSATLSIEAAMVATNTPAGAYRKNFGFMHIVGYDPADFEAVRRKAMDGIRKRPEIKIQASDVSRDAIIAAQENIKNAGFENLIHVQRCDFRESHLPKSGQFILIVNPEYGMRLGDEQALEPIYSALGDFFKQKCKGSRCFIFTGNPNLAKKVGLKAARRHVFHNSNIECRLLEYEMYEGTKRVKEEEESAD
ncbi:THUMP domain-containing class I SAM-dependent RNA methyltransferase [Seleniivibrio woodruffii]|uniref:Putative N6-adenine-specific DNA methylase n=1 Tax=Seleniivibrio woodruffii TaxID=1078050 RepID=A0A4V2PRY5_9BACT|nr:class I SAM-dependent RNA methyltransferase [Seleniivibrio woodruffii]TCK60621.1 putative N6-adenine-specific DNA methylase [Seleniivibrio woodruffii]TVZ36250.1 putative N6-adenine-specific DNA methylase [Seleniivibrio woodruffii]